MKSPVALLPCALLALAMHAGAAWAFAEEDRDWGLEPTRELRQAPYSAPTPLQLPGAQTIGTGELRQLLNESPDVMLVDVAGGNEDHLSLKGALWMPNAGRGLHYFDPVQADTATRLATLTGGDKSRPIVFFCVDVLCWLSYNAGLRAVALGYRSVYWYRGGFLAWREAGLPIENLRPAAELR